MLRVIGGNLKRLGLDVQYDGLEARTNLLVRNAETTAEARQLIRDVQSWLEKNADALRVVRVNEIRGFREVGKEYSTKLQGISRRIEMAELSQSRTQLSDFLNKIKNAESELMRRASRLWQSKIRSWDELDGFIDEVEDLTKAFEGCQADVEDLRLMRRVLQSYKQAYILLQDSKLTWQEFETLAENLQRELCAAFDEEEPPWPADETIRNFAETISKQRKQASLLWIKEIEAEASSIADMAVGDANRLHSKANNPPSVITPQHLDRLTKILKKTEEYLEALALDWLMEKFRELPGPSKKKFLEMASRMLSDP